MTTYDHFDSRNGFSDLENHTLDTEQTFLAASYQKLAFWSFLTQFGQNRSKFGAPEPDLGYRSKVPQWKGLVKRKKMGLV